VAIADSSKASVMVLVLVQVCSVLQSLPSIVSFGSNGIWQQVTSLESTKVPQSPLYFLLC
jgi:hypothetical protein